jgi:DnaJ-class molecular chaperone
MKICKKCKGIGSIPKGKPGNTVRCPDCGGTGIATEPKQNKQTAAVGAEKGTK